MTRGTVVERRPGRLGSEAGELTQRLKAAGAAHLAVDRLVGHSAIASVFAARDIRQGTPVTLKLVESDLAYDVGAAAFVRGIGSTEELGDPHILPPGRDTGHRGALYYVGPHAAAEPLTAHLAQSRPIRTAEGLLIAADIARGLDRWHTLGLAHGEIGWERLLIQNGQVLLQAPSRVTYGWDARRRDIQALARLCLDLLDQTAEPAVGHGRRHSLREVLLRAADQPSTSVSARRLAEKLTLTAEREALQPEAEQAGTLRRLLAAVGRWMGRPPHDAPRPVPVMSSGGPVSLCGFLRGRPYVVRFVEPQSRWDGQGQWLIEMGGVPRTLFPAARGDTETTVRATTERILMRVLPEE